jgi:hypothetical protein
MIHSHQRLLIQMAYVFAQAGAVNRPYMFQKHNRVVPQSMLTVVQKNVSWQRMLIDAAGDSRDNHSGTVTVSDVILDHQNRPDAALFTAYNRCQVSIENISFPDLHGTFLLCE